MDLVFSKAMHRLIGDEAQGIHALDLNTVSPTEVRQMLEMAIKYQRLLYGLPTEVQRQQITEVAAS